MPGTKRQTGSKKPGKTKKAPTAVSRGATKRAPPPAKKTCGQDRSTAPRRSKAQTAGRQAGSETRRADDGQADREGRRAAAEGGHASSGAECRPAGAHVAAACAAPPRNRPELRAQQAPPGRAPCHGSRPFRRLLSRRARPALHGPLRPARPRLLQSRQRRPPHPLRDVVQGDALFPRRRYRLRPSACSRSAGCRSCKSRP